MKKQFLLLSTLSLFMIIVYWGCRKNTMDQPFGEESAAGNMNLSAKEFVAEPAMAYRPQEILIEFVGGEDANTLAGIGGTVQERVRTKAMERFNNPGFSIVRVPDVAAAVEKLKKNPRVRWASPNFIVQTIGTPDDPYFTNNSLWGMTNTKANTIWDKNQGSQDVFIGLIDEGIMYWHEDLCGQIWDNPYDPEDGIDNDGNGYVDDIHGWDFMHNDKTVFDNADNHGTHTAGTIGGKGYNGKGVIGMAPHVTIISAKFLEGSGSISDAIRATDYITDLKTRHNMKIPATSNSWGWGGGGFVQGMYDAIERARTADILFVAAAGNSAVDNDLAKFYPSSMTNDNIISVAAITSTDGIASFSCYGDTSVDLGAPGSGVWSTVAGSNYTFSYASYSGTSMATPHVSGAVALYKSARPGATYAEIKSALLSNARRIAALAGKTVTGGTLDVSFLTDVVPDTSVDRSCVAPAIDYTPPSKPANLRTTSVTSSGIGLAWDASTDAESSVQNYTAYLRWPNGSTTSLTTTSLSASFSSLGPGINYRIYVTAKNPFGFVSPVSDTLFVTTSGSPDTEAPAIPGNFRTTSTTTTSISLAWNASTDNIGVTGYTMRWRRAGTSTYSSVSFNGTSVTVTNLLAATNYEFSVRAYDASQNYSAYTSPDLLIGTVGSDLVPPSTPSNLSVTAAMTNSVALSWDAATDNVGITGYRVYWKTDTGSYQYATSTTNTYTKTGLTTSTNYQFYVVAYDAGGNLSGNSGVVNATTLASDNTPPSKPMNVVATNVATNSISVSWDPSSDAESGIAYYYAYLKWPSGSNTVLYASGTQITFNNIGSGINYSIYVMARNGFNLWSVASDTLKVTTPGDPDTQAPTLPANFRATSIGNTSVSLAWDASSDNMSVIGYNVRWANLSTGTTYSTNISSTSFTYSSLSAATNYKFSIRAYDASQNYSAWYPDIPVSTPGADIQPPSAPSNLAMTSNTTSSISLAWDSSTDNIAVSSYRVYWRTGSNAYAYVTTTGKSYTKTSLASGTAYDFYVVAYDAGGNVSASSNVLTASTIALDTQAPTAPSGLSATGTTTSSITLAWTGSSDNVGVSGYRVYYRTGTNAYTYTTTPNTTINFSGLPSGTTYNYYILAYDAAGNLSASSNVITASTIAVDTQVPSTPTNLTSTGATSSSVSLSWSASSDNVGVSGYRVYYRTGSNSYTSVTVSGTTATLTGLTSASAYNIYVVAFDAAGNSSVSSSVISVSTTDNIAPTAPTSLSSTGSTSSAVSLSWSGATDNIGVTSYRVYYRTGANAFQFVTATGTTATVTGLTAATAYVFYVVAYDAAGNASPQSPTITVSTQVTAPTVAVALSGSQLNTTTHRLTWSVTTNGTLQSLTLEVKKGNGIFTTISTPVLSSSGTYDYVPGSTGKYAYRALARLSNGTIAYSNTINLTIK